MRESNARTNRFQDLDVAVVATPNLLLWAHQRGRMLMNTDAALAPIRETMPRETQKVLEIREASISPSERKVSPPPGRDGGHRRGAAKTNTDQTPETGNDLGPHVRFGEDERFFSEKSSAINGR